MKTLSTPKLSYMPQLDALRAFAVAAVMYAHWAPASFQYRVPWGHAGVQLFFVLSGFLITGILLDARQNTATARERLWALKNFYARRFLRIFPLYYAFIALCCAGGVRPFRETWLWTVSYTTNFYLFVQQADAGPITHLWSLAVEEQFYLVWPLIVLLVPLRLLQKALITCIVFAIGFRLTIHHLYPELNRISYLPFSAADALAIGSLLACFNRETLIKTRVTKIGLCFGAPAWAMYIATRVFGYWFPFQGEVGHLGMLCFFAWLIPAAAAGFTGVVGKILDCGTLVKLGTISYGLYVLHNVAPILGFRLIRVIGWDPQFAGGYGKFAVFLVLTICGATLSWRLLERPINNLKRKFPYYTVTRETRDLQTRAGVRELVQSR